MNQKTEQRQLSPIEHFRQHELAVMEQQIKDALPGHITVDRFRRNLLTSVQEIPGLLNCDRRSLLHAIMTSAQLGLLVGRALGQAWIIPFKDGKTGKLEAVFIPGYRGYIELARNSGEIKSVYAIEVYENDEFEYEEGLEPKLIHKPIVSPKRGEIIAFYAIAHYKSGDREFELMLKEDVDAIRARSKAPNSPAWKNDYNMMGRKTVIRRFAKRLPQDVQKLASIDAAMEMEGRRAYLDKKGVVILEGEYAQKGDQTPKPRTDTLKQFENEGQEPTESPPEPAEAENNKSDAEKPSGDSVATHALSEKEMVEAISIAPDVDTLNKAYADAGEAPGQDVQDAYNKRYEELTGEPAL